MDSCAYRYTGRYLKRSETSHSHADNDVDRHSRKWRNGASPSASSSGAKRSWVGATVIIVDDPQHLSSPNWAGIGWLVAWYRGLLGKNLLAYRQRLAFGVDIGLGSLNGGANDADVSELKTVS